MRVPVLYVRRNMLVVGPDGREHRVIDRELSLPASGVRRPWIRLRLEDFNTGAVTVVRYWAGDEVEVVEFARDRLTQEQLARLVGVRVEVVRYVDDAQPGWVECRLTDAHGRAWEFVEKVPVVTAENLDAGSAYPRPGVIACEVVESRPGGVVVIDTERPWGVAARGGQTRFEVRAGQLDRLA